MQSRLQREFFERPTLKVAQALLGKQLVFGNKRGIITETEAYIGQDDPACHASRGYTKRTSIMFGKAGVSYVYFIYGMYHCLNFVTEKEDFPAAVLIRGLRLMDEHLSGPGKVCRHLGISLNHNGIDITTSEDFYLLDAPSSVEYKATPRIGISKGQDKLWRFVVEPS